jgi:hypothetical protein
VTRRGSSERVGQPQMPLDQKAVLHVFGVQHRTSGQQCRRDDHRIIDREAVAFRQGAPGLMRLKRQILHWAERLHSRQERAGLHLHGGSSSHWRGRHAGAAGGQPAAMQVFLNELAASRPPDAHLVLVLDGAGWHTSRDLAVPPNITLVVCQRR